MRGSSVTTRWRRGAGLGKEVLRPLPRGKICLHDRDCIKNTRGISVADLNKELGKRNLALSNGYGKLKEQTFRIAHMETCR